jgi:hypothetical protein
MVDVKLREKVSLTFTNYDTHYRDAWIDFFKGHVFKTNNRNLNSKMRVALNV